MRIWLSVRAEQEQVDNLERIGVCEKDLLCGFELGMTNVLSRLLTVLRHVG